MELIKYFVELIGTFIFISIILNSLNDNTLIGNTIAPISVAAGLLGVIYFGGYISGGHYNPVVSIAMFFKNKITSQLLLGYIIAQILGTGLAVKFNNYSLTKI